MDRAIVIFIFLSIFLFSPALTEAQTNLKTRIVATNLKVPWEIHFGPDRYLWLTERPGIVSRINISSGVQKKILIIPDVVSVQESGLLGFVFHPNFRDSSFVYFAYTYSVRGGMDEKIVRYRYDSMNDTLINPVIIFDKIDAASIHNGCRLIFGNDEKLYFSTGDASSTSNSQNLNSLNGKILRINSDGSIPNDNPIPGNPVFSWGHRNIQGLTWTPKGTLFASEHGRNSDDEINLILKGRNYGWPNVEGYCDNSAEKQFCTDSSVVEPKFAWTPTIAPSTILYYNHSSVKEWQNSLLMVTLNANGRDLRKYSLNSEMDKITSEKLYFDNQYGRLRAMCIDDSGRVYIATSNRDGRGENLIKPDDDKIIQIYNPEATSLEDENTPLSQLFAFPIPGINKGADQKLYLNRVSTINIFSFDGKRITPSPLTGKEFDLSNFSSGIYFIKSNKGEVLKFIIE